MSVQNVAHCSRATLLTEIITTFNSQKAIASCQSHSLGDMDRITKQGFLAGNPALNNFQYPVSSNRNMSSCNFRKQQHKYIYVETKDCQ